MKILNNKMNKQENKKRCRAPPGDVTDNTKQYSNINRNYQEQNEKTGQPKNNEIHPRQRQQYELHR